MNFSERLNTENTVEVHNAKIGTYTPKLIWVHEDDMPLEEGNHFRYIENEPTETGFYPEYGKIYHINEMLGDIQIYFVSVDGSPTKVQELEIDKEEYI